MNRCIAALPPAILLLLSGCASSLSGVGGEGHYACRAPEGAQCTSVSGVYANSAHRVPQRSAAAETPRLLTLEKPATEPEADAGARLRSNPRLLRIWIAPWEDSDGDLHEAETVHMLVDPGHWLIEHVRPAHHLRPDSVAPPAVIVPYATDAADARPDSSIPATDRLPASPAVLSGGDRTTPEH